MTGSNRRHSACKADALPAELITLYLRCGAHYATGFYKVLIYLKFFQKNLKTGETMQPTGTTVKLEAEKSPPKRAFPW